MVDESVACCLDVGHLMVRDWGEEVGAGGGGGRSSNLVRFKIFHNTVDVLESGHCVLFTFSFHCRGLREGFIKQHILSITSLVKTAGRELTSIF